MTVTKTSANQQDPLPHSRQDKESGFWLPGEERGVSAQFIESMVKKHINIFLARCWLEGPRAPRHDAGQLELFFLPGWNARELFADSYLQVTLIIGCVTD